MNGHQRKDPGNGKIRIVWAVDQLTWTANVIILYRHALEMGMHSRFCVEVCFFKPLRNDA